MSAFLGVKVLDCTQGLAGPLASMLLADFGAEVLKIEPPEGDRAKDKPGYLDLEPQQAPHDPRSRRRQEPAAVRGRCWRRRHRGLRPSPERTGRARARRRGPRGPPSAADPRVDATVRDQRALERAARRTTPTLTGAQRLGLPAGQLRRPAGLARGPDRPPRPGHPGRHGRRRGADPRGVAGPWPGGDGERPARHGRDAAARWPWSVRRRSAAANRWAARPATSSTSAATASGCFLATLFAYFFQRAVKALGLGDEAAAGADMAAAIQAVLRTQPREHWLTLFRAHDVPAGPGRDVARTSWRARSSPPTTFARS